MEDRRTEGENRHQRDGAASLHRHAMECLDAALDKDPLKLQEEVDEAIRNLAALRDRYIEHLRRKQDLDVADERSNLNQINVAISLTAAVEYPATGIHRNMLQEANEVLKNLKVNI